MAPERRKTHPFRHGRERLPGRGAGARLCQGRGHCVVQPPHGESDWKLLVSFVFTPPGRYHLYRLKVGYVEARLMTLQMVTSPAPPRNRRPAPCSPRGPSRFAPPQWP